MGNLATFHSFRMKSTKQLDPTVNMEMTNGLVAAHSVLIPEIGINKQIVPVELNRIPK